MTNPTKKQLQEKMEKLNREKNKVEEELQELVKNEQTKDFIEVKNFRIYKWSKPVKDFPMPKDFRLAEEREFIDLYDSGFKIEQYPVVYFTKNRSKLNIKNGWGLSRLYLFRNLSLDSNIDNLAYSNGNGRVVCIKEKKC